MLFGRRPWQDELDIIDRTMKAISGVTDPEDMVDAYWSGMGELMPINNYVALSRRNVDPPDYLITRSSRFTEHHNPWTHRHLLPRMSGGILGEIIYGNKPVMIDDLPARLSKDDPAYFYLEGFQSMIALPQYDNSVGVNVTAMLMPAGKQLDPSTIPLLHWQGGLFGRGTQNLVLRNELGAALKRLDRELQTVGQIQRSLLPQKLPDIDGFDMAAYYQTSARAGGDYYDFFKLADGEWGMFIADVSGHGTPAAVLMAITHAIAHAQPGTHTPPQDLLRHLNDQLSQTYTREGSFVTAFYAVINPANRTLTYSTAGHNPPRLVRHGNVLSLDQNGALPLGIVAGQAYGQATITMQRGDLLLLYTDGITEAMAPMNGEGSRQLFGTQRLDDLLLDCGSENAEGCLARVRQEVNAFAEGNVPTDDQTLIAIRCEG